MVEIPAIKMIKFEMTDPIALLIDILSHHPTISDQFYQLYPHVLIVKTPMLVASTIFIGYIDIYYIHC